jgi:hypothetical protein
MSTEEAVAEPKVLYTETVVTDHKGNKTKTTQGRKIGGSGQRYYTTTKTKTKTDANGNVTTIEIATTYERPEYATSDDDLNAYKRSYKTPHLKEAPQWEKPVWVKQNVLSGTSLKDGRNLEKPITDATKRTTPATFATFKLEK